MSDIHASLAVPYGQHPRQRFDLFVPESVENPVVVACVPGGWWTHGRHEDLRAFALHLAEQGFATATIGHRLFNDGARSGADVLDDMKTGIHKLLEEAAIDGASPRSVVMLGSGSGSLTALATAARLTDDRAIRVRGAIACGVTPTLDHWDGCTATVMKAIDQFAGSNRHLFSPQQQKPDTLPPLLLLHGDNDLEVPAKLAQQLHAHAIEANEISTLAVLSGLGHQFIEQAFERGAKEALERIIPFLHEYAREPAREQLFFSHKDVMG